MTDGRWLNETEKREANKGEGDTGSFFWRVKKLSWQKPAVLVCKKSELPFLSFPIRLCWVGLKQTTVRWSEFWLGNNFKRKTVCLSTENLSAWMTDCAAIPDHTGFTMQYPERQTSYLTGIVLYIRVVHSLEIYVISIGFFLHLVIVKLYLYNELWQPKKIR